MSQFKHLRCDRCTQEYLYDPAKESHVDTGWAHVRVGTKGYDLCPNCWNAIVLKEDLKIGKGRAEHDSEE